jgi:hypothetical protein
MSSKIRFGIDRACDYLSKSRQQFDLSKPDNIFLFKALVAILCSEPKLAGHMHN